MSEYMAFTLETFIWNNNMNRLIAIILLVIVSGCDTKPVPPPIPPVPPSAIANQLLTEHNFQRVPYKLHDYKNNSILIKVSQDQADFQAARDRIGHDGPGGNSPWDRVRAAGYRFSSMSENAAAGQRSSAEAVADWLTSPGHAANVKGNYIEMGGGMAVSARGTKYWCCVYATPTTSRELERQFTIQQFSTEPIQTKHGTIQ